MEQVILTNDLSELAVDYPLKTWEKSSFVLKESVISQLLTSLYKHPDKRNVYGYLTEISAFRGIFSVIRELIETNVSFREFLKNTLQEQYFPFEQTIRFLRNVLNHSTTSGLNLKQEDYDIQKDFILSPKQQRLHQLKGSALMYLDFTYAKYIPQRKGSKEYGIQLSIDFVKLKPGMELEKIVSWHSLYLLSELCFNLSQIYELSNKKKLVSAFDPPDKKFKEVSSSQRNLFSEEKSPLGWKRRRAVVSGEVQKRNWLWVKQKRHLCSNSQVNKKQSNIFDSTASLFKKNNPDSKK